MCETLCFLVWKLASFEVNVDGNAHPVAVVGYVVLYMGMLSGFNVPASIS